MPQKYSPEKNKSNKEIKKIEIPQTDPKIKEFNDAQIK